MSIPAVNGSTTVELLNSAESTLETIEPTKKPAQAALDSALRAINDSRATFRFRTYASSTAAFDELQTAQTELRRLDKLTGGKYSDRINRASRLLYQASNVSARIAVIDAGRTFSRYEANFETPGQRQTTVTFLENAVRNLQRADTAVTNRTSDSSEGDTSGNSAQNDDGGSQGSAGNTGVRANITARVQGTVHLRNAWKQVDLALDRLEANVEPNLTVGQGPAFDRNGTVRVGVVAQLSDIRPYRYESASVYANNGTQLTTIRFGPAPRSGSTARGVGYVDIGPVPANRTLTVVTNTTNGSRRATATITLSVDSEDVFTEQPAPDEQTQVSVTNASSGVSVVANGTGLTRTDISVVDLTPGNQSAFRAGPLVRVLNRSPVDSARIRIPITENVSAEQNLSVYKLDADEGFTWKRIDATIDRQAGVATAEVDSFSFFSVFVESEWRAARTETVTLTEDELVGGTDTGGVPAADFVFVIDESGSMAGSPISNARTAAKRFVGALTPEDKAAVVGYSFSARLVEGLTTDFAAVNSSIDSLSAGGSTNTGDGLRTALDELQANGSSDRPSSIILLSDGKTNRGPDPVAVAEDAARMDVEINTVGLGSGADERELRRIANVTGGTYYPVESADDLPETFERIAANRSRQLRDSNGDGIPDAVARANPPVPALVPFDLFRLSKAEIAIDSIATDTNLDGLPDNETIDVDYRVFREGNETLLETRVASAVAHPGYYDYDGDGLSEGAEAEVGTSPLLADTSNDGLNDLVDPAPLETTTPPRLSYRNPDYDPGVGTAVSPDLYLLVNADPTGDADEIEEIQVTKCWNDHPVRTIDGSVCQEADPAERIYNYIDNVREPPAESVKVPYGLYYVRDSGFILPRVADNVTVRAIDDDGNYIQTTIETDTNDVSVTTGLQAAVGVGSVQNAQRTVSLGTGSSVLRAVALRASIVGAGAVFLESTTQSYGRDVEGGSAEEEFQPNPVPGIETPPAWPEGLEITLPSGVAYEEGLTIGDGRGYGKEYIIETTDLESVGEIEQIIRTPNAVIERGGYEGYIGDNPNGDGQIIIWIIGGYAVSAEQTLEREETVEDAVEEINEERKENEQLDETDVQDEINNGPEQTNRDPRYRIDIHRIADGVRILFRTGGPGLIVRGIAEQFRDDDDDDDDDGLKCVLPKSAVDMSVSSVMRGEFVAADSGYKLFDGEFTETTNPVGVAYRCVDDREAVVRTYADDPTDLTDGSIGENVTVELIQERPSLDLRFPPGGFDSGDTAVIGPDAIAYNTTSGEYLIIEAKTSGSTDAVGIGLLSNAYNGTTQLSDAWIQASITELEDRGEIDPDLADEVLNATARGNVTKEIVFVRDNPDAVGRTLTTPRSNATDISLDDVVGVDRVTIIELQGPVESEE